LAKSKNNPKKSNPSAATVGYEAQLWQMADALRGNMGVAEDPDEYHSQDSLRAPLATRWAHLNKLDLWERL